MFTGIIEEVGKISNIQKNFNSMKLTVCANKILQGLQVGDSVAINGVCTTVTEFDELSFCVDISSQTIDVTTFSQIQVNNIVNLERAMLVSQRLGGHIVSGHVDFISKFVEKQGDKNSIFLSFLIPKEKIKYFVDKGSVTINGISLTVAKKQENVITVCIIPHTLQNTNLQYLKNGDFVNIEIDIIAKYVENFTVSNDNGSRICEKFLKENGF